MVSETQLRQLRAGNLITYHGVQWSVMDHSSYTEDEDYYMEEWLLQAKSGKEYYLLYERETKDDGERSQEWYIAEQLRYPVIYEPKSSQNLVRSLAQMMLSHQEPYPRLQSLNRIYEFESSTEGDYNSEGTLQHRVTWDYWDQAKLWNLALEAWEDGHLDVYSTRRAQPSEFTNLVTDADTGWRNTSQTVSSRSQTAKQNHDIQVVLAWTLIGLGFMFMISGI